VVTVQKGEGPKRTFPGRSISSFAGRLRRMRAFQKSRAWRTFTRWGTEWCTAVKCSPIPS
jgi:hypothetical protein